MNVNRGSPVLVIVPGSFISPGSFCRLIICGVSCNASLGRIPLLLSSKKNALSSMFPCISMFLNSFAVGVLSSVAALVPFFIFRRPSQNALG